MFVYWVRPSRDDTNTNTMAEKTRRVMCGACGSGMERRREGGNDPEPRRKPRGRRRCLRFVRSPPLGRGVDTAGSHPISHGPRRRFQMERRGQKVHVISRRKPPSPDVEVAAREASHSECKIWQVPLRRRPGEKAPVYSDTAPRSPLLLCLLLTFSANSVSHHRGCWD